MKKAFRTAHWTEADFIQWLEDNCITKVEDLCPSKYPVYHYVFNNEGDVNKNAIKHYTLYDTVDPRWLRWNAYLDFDLDFHYRNEPWKDPYLRLWMKDNIKEKK